MIRPQRVVLALLFILALLCQSCDDYPHFRWRVTSKEALAQISEYSEAGITVRGTFCPAVCTLCLCSMLAKQVAHFNMSFS